MSNTRVVTMHYTLTDNSGKVIDSSVGNEPLTYLEGSGNIIPGLENALLTLQTGAKTQVKVPAKDAYGEKSTDMMVEVSVSQFPPDVKLKVGDRFRAGGGHDSPMYTVIELLGDKVKLDGNHPLAGVDLTFDVEIVETRAATSDEMAHGHAHGPGGHHHH